MKRKKLPAEERRRPRLEFNLIEEQKRLPVPRKGCLSFFGSSVLLAAAASLLAAALR